MRTRRVGVLALVVALSLVVAACSGEPNEGNGATGENAGKITIAMQEDVRSPDNLLMSGTTTDRLMLGSTVYEPLFTTDERGGIQPALATEAASSEDLLTWTITLREGVTFSNGKHFTAADVIANFDAFRNPDNASGYASDLSNVESIEATGDYEVVFHLASPDAKWDTALQDTMFISDLDAREAELLAPEEVPVGTGPYVWSTRQVGSSVTFTPNDAYWRGEPPLTQVVFRAIPDGQTAVIDLQQGSVDMMANYVPPQSLPALQSDPDIELVAAEGSTFYQAYLNFEKDRQGGYADGAKVRQGLAHLLNPEQTVPALIGDFGVLATQPIPSWMDGFNPDIRHIPLDVEEGKRLLAEGGINEGDPIKLLALKDRPFMCEWATAAQSTLVDAGYDAQLTCLDSAASTPQVTAYEWDLLFWRTSGRANAAVMYQQRWGLELASPPTDTYTLQDPDLQSMIDELRGSREPDAYTSLAQSIGERIVVQDVAVIPGYFDNVYFPINKRVKGFVLSPTTWYGILYNAMGSVTTE